MTFPDNFVFSQHSLQDFVDCPRRFQLRYLEKIVWPSPITEPVLEQEKRIMMGASFHRYVQQYLSGISAEGVTSQINDPQMETWWNNFLTYHSNIPVVKNWVEYTLSIHLGNARCMARFDYLFIDANDNIHIVDWKTSNSIPKTEFLERKIQSILYPFLLSELAVLPENYKVNPDCLTMTYWFVNYPDSSIVLPYSKEKQVSDKQYVLTLIDQIRSCSADNFILTMDRRKCKFCNYRSLCDRGIKAGQLIDWEDNEEFQSGETDLDFDQIGEIAF